ncbi:unnamed protein product [Clavelina lepadiformis]|uniref:Uncharacterized protein n=1 Tax=Clavelina lepadiformis TaxID=159417 RepID=A0ABP0FDS8_CLALP
MHGMKMITFSEQLVQARKFDEIQSTSTLTTTNHCHFTPITATEIKTCADRTLQNERRRKKQSSISCIHCDVEEERIDAIYAASQNTRKDKKDKENECILS